MKRKFIGFTAAVVLMMSVSANVHAEDFYGGDGWNVTFDGEKMNSTFKSTDIDDAVYQLQPGDTVNLQLSLKNTYKGDTDWYMSNKVLKSLEDSQSVAEGGAYSYILTYIQPDGHEKILYSSEAVGGETINESGEGLHQATDSLEDFFYLDKLEKGEAGRITLRVKLEGETQGNEYQDTLAKLQMNFAVEPLGEDEEIPPSKRKLIKTGDTTNVLFFVWVTLISGLVCAAAAFYRMYRQDKNQDENDKRRLR